MFKPTKGLHVLGMKAILPSQVVEGEIACKSSSDCFAEKSEFLFAKLN